MSMSEWLQTEHHNVENFNKIFNLSKIEKANLKSPVVLGDLHTGELREVFVNGELRFIQLKSSSIYKIWGRSFAKSENIRGVKVPNIIKYRSKHKKVFQFISLKGKVDGNMMAEEILDLPYISIKKIVKDLKSMGLVKIGQNGTLLASR